MFYMVAQFLGACMGALIVAALMHRPLYLHTFGGAPYIDMQLNEAQVGCRRTFA
jgi:glycerol uptake facilitator-like aquaporin